MRWQVFQLLSQMLGGNNLTALIAQADAKDLWPAVLRLSSYQMVTPNLYWALSRDATIWQAIPEEPREYLSNIFELNTLRNQAVLDEASEIVSALNQHKIVPLILKNTGELLSRRTPHLGYRLQTDTDLLVRPEQLEQSYELIQQLGYNVAQEQLGEHGPELHIASANKLASVESEYEYHHHLPPLIKAGASAPIELHRHAYGRRFQHKFPLAQIFDEAQLCQHDDLQFLVMSPAQRQQHLVHHCYINDGLQARYEWPLRTACDWLYGLDRHPPKSDDPQLLLFDGLVNKVMLNIPSTALGVKHHYRCLRLGLRSKFVAALLRNYGRLTGRSINLWHNPQLLRKHWRLWRDS